MASDATSISELTATGWCVFGAVLAFLSTFLLPELVRQIKRERKSGVKYRPTGLMWAVGGIVFAITVGAGVGVAELLDPCSKGDAWLCGLGAVSFLSGALGTVSVFNPASA